MPTAATTIDDAAVTAGTPGSDPTAAITTATTCTNAPTTTRR